MSRLPVDPDLIDGDGGRARGGEVRWDAARVAAPGPMVLAVIALGGGLGSLARYGVALWMPTTKGGFPWSTFLVNVVGCLLIGALMVVATEIWPKGRLLRPFLGIGALGGLTTYSTMMLDLRTLGSSGEWLTAGGYLLGSLVGGVLAVWAGVAWMRRACRGRPSSSAKTTAV